MTTLSRLGITTFGLFLLLLSVANADVADEDGWTPVPIPATKSIDAPRPTQPPPPLAWKRKRIDEPHRVALYILRVDLRSSQIAVATFIADDPDGDGPAEAELVNPVELALRHQALAAVNANAFSPIPDEEGNVSRLYFPGMPVDILGLAAADGERRSGVHAPPHNDLCLWFDPTGRPHIGTVPHSDVQVALGINAWWGDLVKDGEALPPPGGDRHPRTAAGFDASGKWLFLVVVDGRQPGYSEGMTLGELADFMVQLGTNRAINLDGGGSSVMLIADENGRLQVVNQPSGRFLRPVPVLIGVRAEGQNEPGFVENSR
jgi:hypothetical protein